MTSPSRAPEADASDAPRDDLGVYRNDHRRTDEAERDTNVVFWNDHKTTQELVRQLLRGHFDIPEPHATRLMLLIHRDGRAVIGAFVPSEAKLLVDLALAHARAAGYPLAITLESKTAPTHPASP